MKVKKIISKEEGKMEKYKNKFIEYLKAEDKESCVNFALDLVHKEIVTISALYEEILGPALNSINSCPGEEPDCIWKEHMQTSIVRTVIECCYPFVVQEVNKKRKLNIKVLVLCPENELHEIGARMVSDFFLLNGYDAVFVGSNTPKEQIKAAIARSKPRYIAISVTDYYNLVAAKNTIHLAKQSVDLEVKILVGGSAFRKNIDAVAQIGADLYIDTYEDIKRLGEEDYKNAFGV